MLNAILLDSISILEAERLLEDIKEVRETLALTPKAWTIIDPLLNQTVTACHRRIRGDA